MAILTKKEFCTLVGMETKRLSRFVDQGRVVLNNDGTITDSLPVNAVFLKNYQDKIALKKSKDEGTFERKPVYVPPPPKPRKKVLPVGDNDDQEIEANHRFNIELETKQVALKRAKVDLELKEIDRAKKLAELIPLELVKPIMKILAHSMVTEIKNYVEESDRIFFKKFNVPAKEAAERKGLLTKGINVANEKAMEAAVKKVLVMAQDFANTKGVGEHG
jgi:hypothetical protein